MTTPRTDTHHHPAPGASSRSTLEQEAGTRKAAILFTDLKGSSAFFKEHGNFHGRVMIQKLNDMLFPIVRAHNGKVVKTIGDSIMAFFPAPQDALWTAVAMQKRLESHNTSEQEQHPLLIRIAVNYGSCIIEEHDMFGDAVNVAGKLVTFCKAREILITEALYREVSHLSEISFTPFAEEDGQQLFEDTPVFRAEWHSTPTDDDTAQYCILSMSAEPLEGSGTSTADISKAISLIKRRARSIVSAEKTEINALFHTAETCLETAQQAMTHILNLSSQFDTLPDIVKIGIHAAGAADMNEKHYTRHINASVSARACADPYEILLTRDCYTLLPARLKKNCLPSKTCPKTQKRLYLFQGSNPSEQQAVFSSFLPRDYATMHSTRCFYCGSTNHQAAACPSKFIRSSTNHLDRLLYLPLAQIQQMFHEHFVQVVSPLQSPTQESRYERLFKANNDDPYALCFFSYYEITRVFQIRALSCMGGGPGSASAKTGSVHMAEDCLRVSRVSEARTWFEKALEEQPDNYRAHAGLGLLYAEQANPKHALYHLKKALSCRMEADLKPHIHLLLARIHEIFGDPAAAKKEAERITAMYHDFDDARYYLAVLLAKTGKLSTALKFFKQLIHQTPRYFLIVSLDPELHCVRKQVTAFLNKEISRMRTEAHKAYKKLNAAILKYKPLFEEGDGQFRTIRDLARKASTLLRQESIAGLMDIPGFELNIDMLIKRALESRIGNLRKAQFKLQKLLDSLGDYLARFPYRIFIAGKHYAAVTSARNLLEEVHTAAGSVPPPGFSASNAMVEKINASASRLAAIRNRLDVLKILCFSLECGLKTAGVILAVTAVSACLFTVVLCLYQGYEGSLSSLTPERLTGYFAFACSAGLVAGLGGATLWFWKRFSALHKKIEL